MGTHTVPTSERLAKLRELMKKKENDVNVYVVPSEDQHGSEYIAECDERRAFISGFDGSAGCAIVTLDKALMFTDGRYFLQAGQQLDDNWTLMKQGLPDVPTWQEYLINHLGPSSRIGIDATLIGAENSSNLSKNLEKTKSSLVSLSTNLVDIVWGSSRPARPKNPIFHLDEKYSGESHTSKLTRVRQHFVSLAEKEREKDKNANANLNGPKVLVLTALDDIAWLFNLRGSDIAYNPVFFSYAVVHLEEEGKAILFLQRDGIETDVLNSLQEKLGEEVEIRDYDGVWEYLKSLGKELNLTEKQVAIPNTASLAVAEAIGTNLTNTMASPITSLKAIKNDVETEGFRQSHIRDGAALARYFAWLEERLQLIEEGKEKELTEWEGAEKLEEFRKELALFKGLSFDTISSTGPNGAIIHYSPDPKDCAVIKQNQIYLCDSGAQFFDGTTDVTRTWHFGTPTDEEKRAATRVLQGHIAIDTAVFPNGTTGYIIDSWARRALWKDGLDFRHGTGHGVGHFLNVHEGPHGIGTRIACNETPLKKGMTVSNEPGYYADGKFGIRIENVVIVKEVQTPNNFGDKGYLGFERLTMCPIQTKLLDQKLLALDEVKWLNDYHAEVWQKVSPLLKNDERALKWLEKECKAI
ncbi:Creatinase/aminopeptidase [Dendrothele bispora CBS 962.96]|uniref:Creatinase/aminopeptidase n=1 Tax=Dendrothele bispora (strain CBS 962.96) TaxID=1314807 RepID=A0A4S8MV86_DENBC|nr:Creatinase/aminopeptidase [Dendrothele bispora CBS 962.96]